MNYILFALLPAVFFGFLVGKFFSKKKVDAAEDRANRYATAVDDLDKWCGHPFPYARIIARHLNAAGEGKGLNAGTPHGEEACTIQGLREQLTLLKKKESP